MAAAALWGAVRRLGVGVRAFQVQGPQRINYTAAAADNVLPNSSRRTTTSSSTSCGASAASNSIMHVSAKSNVELLAKNSKEYLSRTLQKEIQNKQEELFSLIAKVDIELPSHCTGDNRQMLMCLSAFFKPKPHDLQWRFFRRVLTCNICIIYGSTLGLAYMALQDDISKV